MGTYGITEQELGDAIIEMLDNLQGEVYKDDFLTVSSHVAKQYKHWSE